MSGYSEKDIEIKIIGLRKGEKLYEELTIDKNSLIKSNFEKILISKEKFNHLNKNEIEQLIKEAENVSKQSDPVTIKEFLKRYVIEYKN